LNRANIFGSKYKRYGKTICFSVRLKIRKLRAEFDGKTQAVRGALIAELEELHRWALERVKAVRDEKLKKHRGDRF